jgi:hypothetical protein
MPSTIIIFLTKASCRNARRECGNNWSCYCFLFEKKIVNVLYNVTYSPSHRLTGAPIINILSTLRTAPGLCKNVSIAILFGSNGNSYTVSTRSDMCTRTHILNNIEKLIGPKNKNIG